ncbi:alanine racemase [Bacteroidetes/Chlorobi group bacterium ChocPot_Mid]|nr:MAG: alanine racemase [Bacteroidetes/Chlorobi group bacterium ChocPot_Mid]
MRTTTAYINKKNLRYNIKRIRELSPGSAIMAIVKANAYGHGLLGTAQILRYDGIEFLGVAFANEGVMLRESGDTQPIIVLIPSFPDEAQYFCKYDLQSAISSEEFLLALSKEAQKRNVLVKTHLLIDTGMHRDGIDADNAVEFMKQYGKLPNIDMHGICTHFATSPTNIDYAKKQLKLFNQTLTQLKEAGFEFKYIHASNSGAIANLPDAYFNLVRPGLALYGYAPSAEVREKLKVKPIMTLKSQVVVTRRIQAGESVSYDRLFVAKKPTTIATVPIGYGDGYFKTLTGRAQCLINGKRYPVVGSICMDEIMVDCNDDEVKPGDEVVLIGKQGSEEILADEIAGWVGTIPYEITTAISARVSRVYIEPVLD